MKSRTAAAQNLLMEINAETHRAAHEEPLRKVAGHLEAIQEHARQATRILQDIQRTPPGARSGNRTAA